MTLQGGMWPVTRRMVLAVAPVALSTVGGNHTMVVTAVPSQL